MMATREPGFRAPETLWRTVTRFPRFLYEQETPLKDSSPSLDDASKPLTVLVALAPSSRERWWLVRGPAARR
jgi:hypothetical protein